jgi:hypothetical protein
MSGLHSVVDAQPYASSRHCHSDEHSCRYGQGATGKVQSARSCTLGPQDGSVFLRGTVYRSLLHSLQLNTGRKHEFNFRSKADLLTEIQRQTRKGGGIPVRALKESWKEAPQAIEELEADGEVLVTRTLKDGQLRMVFWNEIKPNDDEGGLKVEKGACCSASWMRLSKTDER